MNPLPSLHAELDAFRAGWESRVGDTAARLIAGDIDDLRNTGVLDRAARAGDAFPETTNLLDARGRPFDLGTLMAAQPTLVTFYRGGWCPYCNLELRAYQRRLASITAMGATLIAVSPERPDASLSTAEKNDLEFAVLSDVGGALASALGIRFTLSEAVRPYYEKAGHALPERNGDGEWALPIPATYVVELGGRIARAFIEPDYRRRADPDEVVQALRSIAAVGRGPRP